MPQTPEEIRALQELVQHNKTQFTALVERFRCARHQYQSLYLRASVGDRPEGNIGEVNLGLS